ncbi:MAG: hypothetical protein JWO67_4815 [Streptosporangiaceae bacterium]|nr:hypothetical protein [Streptosporangiaceae bacterium]
MSAGSEGPRDEVLLARLRSDWPDWEFMVIRRRWIGVLAERVVVWASSEVELRDWLHTRFGRDPEG